MTLFKLENENRSALRKSRKNLLQRFCGHVLKEDTLRKMGEMPTLGVHVRFIRDICKKLQKSQPNGIVALIEPLAHEKLANPLTAFRNNYKGHGAVPSTHLAEDLLEEMADKFGELLKRVACVHREYPSCIAQLGTLSEDFHVVLKNADDSIYLDLYPLFLAAPCAKEVSIIYNGRKKKTDVQYLDYQTGDGFIQKPGEAAADAFNAEFPPPAKKGSSGTGVPGPGTALIEARSRSFKGRDADLRAIDQFMSDSSRNVLVITGAPGQGKTSLLCKWLSDRPTEPNSKERVIRHFIVEGDSQTCATISIFKSLCSQLEPGLDRRSSQKPDWKTSDWQQEFVTLLSLAGETCEAVYVVIDGLDEAERHRSTKPAEDSILEWLPAPSISAASVRWLLSIRPQYLQDPAFRAKYGKDKARHHQLGKLDGNAIRAILYDHGSNWREVALREDLVDIILEKSEGSPIYIHQLAEDLEERRLEFSEAGIATIPQGMAEFHHRIVREIEDRIAHRPSSRDNVLLEAKKELLLEQCEAGEISREVYEQKIAAEAAKVQSTRSLSVAQMLGLLAVCHEPLPVDRLAELMRTDRRPLQEILEEARSVLNENDSPTPSEGPRYSLYHSSFREFILQYWPKDALWGQDRFEGLCSDPYRRKDAYVMRHGVSHLLNALRAQPSEENRRNLADLLCDLDYITTKIRAGLVPELLQDYERALTFLTGSPSSMFHGLEVDDEDRTWIEANHAARLAGQPLPFPDKGGDYVVRKIRERLEEERRQRQEADRIRKAENLAAGRPEDYYWEFDDELTAEPLAQAADPLPADKPDAAISPSVSQGDEWDWAAEAKLDAEQREAERFRIASRVFAHNTATARGVEKIRERQSNISGERVVDMILAFSEFVEANWPNLREITTNVASLCRNFRTDGSVNEIGKKLTAACGDAWIENLHPPNVDVRQLKLAFSARRFEIEPDDVCFFDNFGKCLRVTCSDWGPKKVPEYTFELFDVRSNRSISIQKVRHSFEGVGQTRVLRVSAEGEFGRFRSTFFRLNPHTCEIELLAETNEIPTTQLVQIRGIESKSVNLFSSDMRQIVSNDGVLRLVTDFDSDLYLLASGLPYEVDLSGRLHGINSKVRSIDFMDDGRLVALKNPDGASMIDLISWTVLHRVVVQGSCCPICYSDDGRLIATDEGGSIRIWDTLSGNLLKEFGLSGDESSLQFSPSGELFYGRGYLCDLRTGGSPESINDASALSLGSKDFCLILINDRLIRVLDDSFAVTSFKKSGLWIHDTEIEYSYSRLITEENWKSPDDEKRGFISPSICRDTGMVLLPCHNGILYLMNPADGRCCLINDSEYLKAMDTTVGQAMLEQYIESPWEINRRERWVEASRRLELDEPAGDPDQKRPQFYINAAVISDDGQWILTATNWDAVRVWDVTSGLCVSSFPLPTASDFFAGHVEAFSLTPDGVGCYICLQDGTSHLLESWMKKDSTWSLVLKHSGTYEVYCRALVNRRYAYLSASTSNSHEIHDLVDRRIIDLTALKPHVSWWPYGDFQLTITPDNRHLVVADELLVIVFNLNTMKEVTRFPLATQFKAMSNISPDGRFVVLTAAKDLLRLKLHLPQS